MGSSGPLLAALVAAAAALPGLWFPFLSDDWVQIRSVISGIPMQTPFNVFRPVYMATLWWDHALWGLSPAMFHATNLLLIAAAAALLTLAVQRLTGEAGLALGTGLLFAIHPFHVETAAWVAARSDPLFTVFWLMALLAYDRWRIRSWGLPILTLVLYELALASKESAVTLPFVLILLGYLSRRRPSAAEWRRGYLPLFMLSGAHMLVLRTWVLSGPGRTLSENLGLGSPLNVMGMAAGGVLPLTIERLSRRPALWGAAAIALVVCLLLLAWKRSGGIPRLALAAPALFVVLATPSLVGFQERYLFLPAAAAAVFFAALIRSIGGRLAWTLAGLLAAGWIAGTASRWDGWREAATASRRLVGDLAALADSPGVEEIVVADMPFRVRGGSVAGDFTAALDLLGRRSIRIRALTYVSFPDAFADPLAGRGDSSILRAASFAELRLAIPSEPFWRFVGPYPSGGVEREIAGLGSIRLEPDGALRLRIVTAQGRIACVWRRGRLERLF